MQYLIIKAYATLLRFDVCVVRRDFSALYRKVRGYPLEKPQPDSAALEQICSAVDVACVWYWKEVLCLQRSAATACLLKRAGFPARMVLGVQQKPFKAHAWVEVEGRVVNDKPYIREMYEVLDQC